MGLYCALLCIATSAARPKQGVLPLSTSTSTATSLSSHCPVFIIPSLHTIRRLLHAGIIVAVTASCILAYLFFLAKPLRAEALPGQRAALELRRRFPRTGFIPYPALPCPAPRRLPSTSSSIHHTTLTTTNTSLACCLRLLQHISHPCSDRTRFYSFVFAILPSASGQRCRRVRLISTRRFRRRAA